jgi:predicted transcriptional regulator
LIITHKNISIQFMKTIKDQIEKFVAETGMSRYCLAKEAGVTETLLSNIKTGRQTDTGFQKVSAIHAAMKRLDPVAAAKALDDACEA